MTTPNSGTLWASAERALGAPATVTRSELHRAIMDLGFSVETDQLFTMHASRGSSFGKLAMQTDKLPVNLTVGITEAEKGCTVSIVCRNRVPKAGRLSGAPTGYGPAFADVIAGLDACLARLDPSAKAAFAPMSYGGTGAGYDATASSTAKLSAKVFGRANKAMEGGPSSDPRKVEAGSGAIWLVTSKSFAMFDLPRMATMSTVGLMVVTKPGSMQPKLIPPISKFLTLVDERTGHETSPSARIRVELDDDLMPVVDFLARQGRLRDTLPLRTLQVCTTCRLEKIVNPDYQRLQNRNRKLRLLEGSVGGVINSHGISPFLLIGKLLMLKQLDPNFVCPRCQGMTAESTIVTFCPKCGERRGESALRTCDKCQHDFRRDVPAETLWQPLPEALPGPAAAVLPGATGPQPITGGQPPADPAATADVTQLIPSSWAPPDAAQRIANTWVPSQQPAQPASFGWMPPPDPASVHHQIPAPSVSLAASSATVPPMTFTPTTFTAMTFTPTATPTPTVVSAAPAIQIAVQPVPATDVSAGPASWFADPTGRHELRWWDGATWSNWISDRGVTAADPMG